MARDNDGVTILFGGFVIVEIKTVSIIPNEEMIYTQMVDSSYPYFSANRPREIS